MPYYPQPRPPQYGSGDRQAQSMLDLIMRQGQVQSAAALNSGNVWGNAVNNAGQILAGGIQQHAAETAKKEAIARRTAALDSIFSGPEPPSLGDLVKVMGPKDGADIWKGIQSVQPDAAKRYQSRQEQLRDAARGVRALPPERQEAGWQIAANGLVNSGVVKPEEIPEFNPDVLTQLANFGQEPAKAPGTRAVTRRNADGSEVTEIVPDVPGQSFESAPPPERRQMVTTIGPGGRPIQRLATEAELAVGVPAYREPRGGGEPPSLQRVETADGIRTFNPRTGEVGPVIAQPPPPARASRPPTGAERTNLGFYNRAEKASKDITDKPSETAPSLEEKVAKAGAFDDFRLQYGSNLIQSPEQQQYRQAQRAFTEARLRKESGAAIPPAEYENDARTYFAQPGDSKEVMEQKRAARDTVLDSLRFSSGKAYEEYYGEPQPTPRNRAGGEVPPPPGAPAVGTVQRGFRYKGGDPALPTSWERQ